MHPSLLLGILLQGYPGLFGYHFTHGRLSLQIILLHGASLTVNTQSRRTTPFACKCLRGVCLCARVHYKVHRHSAGVKNPAQNIIFLKSEWNKWKNQTEGDVGMSRHEKKGNKKMHTPNNPIPN